MQILWTIAIVVLLIGYIGGAMWFYSKSHMGGWALVWPLWFILMAFAGKQ